MRSTVVSQPLKTFKTARWRARTPSRYKTTCIAKSSATTLSLYTEINATKTADSQDAKQWSVTVPAGSIGYLYINKDANAGSYWPVALTIDQRTINNEAWRFDNNIRQIADASDGPSSHTVSLEVAEGYSDMPQSNEPGLLRAQSGSL